MLENVKVIWVVARVFLATRLDRTEAGSAVEKVILTAIFAALALTIGAIITAKVVAKAHSINLN